MRWTMQETGLNPDTNDKTTGEIAMCKRKLQKILLVSVVIAVSATAWSQGRRGTGRILSALPGAVAQQEAAVGGRVKSAGKEQTIYVGEFVDAQGNRSAAQVLHQLPTLVRLEGFSHGRVLSFDGERTVGVLTKSDETAIEVFAMDGPEGMFAALRKGASLRHLGSGFGPDPRLNPNYKGPRLDIFNVVGPAMVALNHPLQSKLYYFDSETGFLQTTRYNDDTTSPPIPKETRFSGWAMIDDSAYASRIEHYEGGRLVFSFSAKAITSAKAADPARFR
jgi:hypothetical protein